MASPFSIFGIVQLSVAVPFVLYGQSLPLLYLSRVLASESAVALLAAAFLPPFQYSPVPVKLAPESRL